MWASASECQRAAFPRTLPKRSRFKRCSVTFLPSITVPSYEALCIDELELSSNERDQYLDFSRNARKTIGPGGYIHRLLGYPDEIQTEMQLECQLVSNGIYYGNSTGRNDPRALALKAGAKDWELLLQIDTENAAGMMWGDVGRLYYWIPRVALDQKNFEATWMIMQCT